MCGRVNKTINHLLSEYSKMAQKEYKRRHDWIAKRIHWEVYRKCKIQVKKKWYEHKPKPVTENAKGKILWNFNIWTDHVVKTCRLAFLMLTLPHKNNLRHYNRVSKVVSYKRSISSTCMAFFKGWDHGHLLYTAMH